MRLLFDPPPRLLGVVSAAELTLPLMATRLCAGFPSPAEDFLDDALDLQRLLAPNPPATFLWQVTGNSMIEVGIFDGDRVVVDKSKVPPKDGDIVVACVNGEFSLKVFRQGRLTFANRDMPAWPMDETADIVIWGVVTWTLHKPRA